MKAISISFLFFFISVSILAQKDTLQLGDRYAEDQIYATISYAQFFNQPTTIFKSNFSYGLSAGYLKDISLNKKGTIAMAIGFGYGFDYFNHKLTVQEVNSTTLFSDQTGNESNIFTSQNLELPFELRWRTSNATKYDFWRIYAGIKFLYNLSNNFKFIDTNNSVFNSSNVSSYNKLQYGLTLSTGYDEFNFHIFYGLSPVFKDSTLNGENINTKILKVGLVFYLL
ncbi:porin family protein [uncultured Polaribacter sp.]|uniref:porin family protein n=1 Tax=uncultured Polaribacter sp. TaxID=174711 RepID=UPI0026220902|nr:porin family protein [uncultured Polaribacter sp.]